MRTLGCDVRVGLTACSVLVVPASLLFQLLLPPLSLLRQTVALFDLLKGALGVALNSIERIHHDAVAIVGAVIIVGQHLSQFRIVSRTTRAEGRLFRSFRLHLLTPPLFGRQAISLGLLEPRLLGLIGFSLRPDQQAIKARSRGLSGRILGSHLSDGNEADGLAIASDLDPRLIV
ncbi:hypothetical protein AEJ54_04425 [Azospirillum sp. Sp 7]|nr:hypothetical protein AMK58_27960 [Azospirillum brasilense]PWC96452.1 hypothetical protein AEJ54_04425 [Azospirillum sp. Sp 7]